MRGLLKDMSSSRKIACWFMLSTTILVNWMQFACLISVEGHGGKLYHVCFTNCVVLTLTN